MYTDVKSPSPRETRSRVHFAARYTPIPLITITIHVTRVRIGRAVLKSVHDRSAEARSRPTVYTTGGADDCAVLQGSLDERASTGTTGECGGRVGGECEDGGNTLHVAGMEGMNWIVRRRV